MRPFITFALVFFATAVLAQEDEVKYSTYPLWTVSKDVQLIQYRNTIFKPARIYTGNAYTISKDVNWHQTMRRTPQPVQRVSANGMPASVVSKGLARHQYQKSLKKN